MTLNGIVDNGCVVCVILPNSVAFRAHYIKVVKDRLILSGLKCSLKNLVFSGISLMATFKRDHSQRVMKMKCPPVASENLTYNQP